MTEPRDGSTPKTDRRLDRRLEDEARELHRLMAMHRTNQAFISLAIAAFCLFTILGVLAYGIINTNNRAKDAEKLSQQGVSCLIEQFAEHRENTIVVEDQLQDNLGLPPFNRPNPSLEPNQLENKIQTACKRFIK